MIPFNFDHLGTLESEFLVRAVEQGGLAVVITDMNGNIVYVNSKFSELTGYSSEEAVGKNPRILKSGEQSEEVYKELWSKLTSGKEWVGQLLNRGKDRQLFWEKAVISPIRDKSGETRFYMALKEDITATKAAEEKLAIQQEQLKLINRILRHDLTNDLVAISSALSLFSNQPQPEYLDEARIHIDKSLSLISRMRDLENSPEHVLLLIDLKPIINTLESLYPQVKSDLPEVLYVLADSSVSSVLDNIVTNAIHHGRANRINISTRKEDNRVILDICDNGCGIPAENRDKIFLESFTGDKQRHTGLGLYIVKKIMLRYGGEVNVSDPSDGGVCFHLYFRSERHY